MSVSDLRSGGGQSATRLNGSGGGDAWINKFDREARRALDSPPQLVSSRSIDGGGGTTAIVGAAAAFSSHLDHIRSVDGRSVRW